MFGFSDDVVFAELVNIHIHKRSVLLIDLIIAACKQTQSLYCFINYREHLFTGILNGFFVALDRYICTLDSRCYLIRFLLCFGIDGEEGSFSVTACFKVSYKVLFAHADFGSLDHCTVYLRNLF